MKARVATWAAVIGAGMTYLLDPRSGRRRRALARDKANHGIHAARSAAGKIWEDGMHRLKGFVRGEESRLFGDGAQDDVILERVRARIGRVVRHPGAVEVHVEKGRVTLTGPVLADESAGLVKRIRLVKGVRDVENGLKVYERPNDVPALQGKVPRRQEKPEFLQESWSPAIRFLAGAAAAGSAAAGRRIKGWTGAALELGGGALAIRSLTNLPFRDLFGFKAGRDVVEFRKTLHLAAPLDRVFAVWCDYENFPKFMSHVRKVEETDVETGVARWTVDGPAGVPVQWNAILTEIVHNQVLAWKTLEGSFIQHEGRVRFFPENGGARVEIQLAYNPGAGAVGHALAKALGADPKRRMDEDLARMKTFIEREERGTEKPREEPGDGTF